MASMTLHVPVELVEVIHDELLSCRDVQYDVLGDLYEDDPERARKVERDTAANLISVVDAVLELVRWDDLRPDQPVDLTADDALLRDIVFGAVLVVADQLVTDLHAGGAQTFNAHEVVRPTVAKLGELLDLHALAAGGES